MDLDYARIMGHIHTQHKRIEELERRVLDLQKRLVRVEDELVNEFPPGTNDPWE